MRSEGGIMSREPDAAQRFANALQELVTREDRATLAALRRGLGKDPGEVPEMHPFVLRWMPESVERWREDHWYLVASLFAVHRRNWAPPDSGHPHNLGESFARLREK